MATYEATKAGYINLWNSAVVRSNDLAQCQGWAGQIISYRSRYLTVQQQTGVVWWFIGCLHMRESSLNFETYLGDGTALAGRWPTFEAGAVYAMQQQGFIGITDWPVSRELWAAEDYNGWGYVTEGVNSPYLWSGTNHYGTAPNVGKFSADGVFSPSVIDPQMGTAAILGCLILQSSEIANYLAAYGEEPILGTTPTPPPPFPIPAPTAAATVSILYTGAGMSITLSGSVSLTVNNQPINPVTS